MENAIPKDRVILINVDTGWTVARYNKVEDKFVYAMPQTDLYQGEWQDHYFENEWIKESEIKEYMEIPSVNNGKEI